jgi:dihydroorotase/N-acyl-D-amino-acid deacylase
VLGATPRDRGLISMETAVHKMTGMAAQRLRLKDRGMLREGLAADVTVFDPKTVKDESTFPDPHRYPTGIPYVIVNGAVVVDRGRMSTERAGRILRRPT